MPEETTKIQTESTKIQTTPSAKNQTPVKTVQEADRSKEIEPELKPKYIPTAYNKQELGDAQAQEDGSVTRTLKLSDPVVPSGQIVDDRFKTQTQVVTYRNNKRVGCKILDASEKELTQLNTAMLDG